MLGLSNLHEPRYPARLGLMYDELKAWRDKVIVVCLETVCFSRICVQLIHNEAETEDASLLLHDIASEWPSTSDESSKKLERSPALLKHENGLAKLNWDLK